MAGKNVYRVGTDGQCNWPTLASIPTEILTQGDTTFLVFPGNYTAPTNMAVDDAAFIGVGDREEIAVLGSWTFANTSANTITFENMSFVGANAVAASGSACVVKLGAAATPIHFKRTVFSNADYAVIHSAELAFATTTRQVKFEYVDAPLVDRAIRANANVEINFSSLNTSSNAYFTPGGGSGVPQVLVRVSTSAGSNTGNSTKSVLAVVT